MSEEQSHISFPPGTISEDPLRIPLVWNGEAGIALDKPAGLAAFQDTRVGGGPRSILSVFNKRPAGKGSQFERLGIHKLFSVNLLEREVSGLVLYAKSEEARGKLKNAMGSSQFSFRYRFVTAGTSDQTEILCSLPVAVHREKPLALISNRTGKKTTTVFHRLQDFGSCSLWESESSYDRFHQVRLHAAEAGLPILGDSLYENTRQARATGRKVPPIAYDTLCLHLFALRFPLDDTWIDLEAPYPRILRMFLAKLAGPAGEIKH